jgi:hypothetical protein
VDPTDVTSAITDTIAAAIRAEIGKGEYRRDQRAANWAGALVGRRLGFDMETPQGKQQARDALAALIKKGTLDVEQRQDAARRFRDYVVPGKGV